MGKKFTIDEFKMTFGKPSLPKGLSSKKKDELEAAAKKKNNQDFEAGAAEMYKDHPDYFVELLSYKFAKHFDADTRDMWLDRSPEAAVFKVLDTLFGKGLDDTQLEKALDDYSSNFQVKKYLLQKYPDKSKEILTTKLGKVQGEEKVNFIRNTPMEVQKAWFEDGYAKKDPELVRAGALAYTMLKPDEQRQLAESDPEFFVETIVQEYKINPNAVDLFKNKALMDVLAKDAKAWKKLVESTPVLSLSDAAKKRVGKDTPTKEEMTEALFQSLVANDGIELTYFTCTLDQDRAVLTGMNDTDAKNRTEKAKELGVEVPDKPATQCHNLKGVLKHALQANLGNAVKIEEGQIVGMLLTKPLSGMPGGLLPNTFGGNVRDDSGGLTGQVMFTGVGGLQSHTWLIIDGVPFDPVLGTKGDQVAGSVAEEFDWKVPEILGKGKKGNFIVKDPSSKPAANSHGFGSCYRLTKHPENFVKGVIGANFTVDKDAVKVEQVLKGGPAEGILEANDLVLKVDNAAADKTKLDDYSRGDAGTTRVFEIRRNGKKKKVKVTASSPLSFA